mmetsp:Transcript_20980/g.50072  ORF Transcript_20980/g.50072 Transcript_20980/m.50072 type:complete len:346 (+) Transcript_20980:1072-2109(+)
MLDNVARPALIRGWQKPRFAALDKEQVAQCPGSCVLHARAPLAEREQQRGPERGADRQPLAHETVEPEGFDAPHPDILRGVLQCGHSPRLDGLLDSPADILRGFPIVLAGGREPPQHHADGAEGAVPAPVRSPARPLWLFCFLLHLLKDLADEMHLLLHPRRALVKERLDRLPPPCITGRRPVRAQQQAAQEGRGRAPAAAIRKVHALGRDCQQLLGGEAVLHRSGMQCSVGQERFCRGRQQPVEGLEALSRHGGLGLSRGSIGQSCRRACLGGARVEPLAKHPPVQRRLRGQHPVVAEVVLERAILSEKTLVLGGSNGTDVLRSYERVDGLDGNVLVIGHSDHP